MLQNDIPKDTVMHFSEKLRDMITFENEDDRNLIKKGLNLYRQGSVYNVQYNGQTLEGRVQDVTAVDVTLDLDFLEMSSCSCPDPIFCRHRMALFFYMYASVDRVGSLLDQWKEGNKPKPTLASIPVKKGNVLQRVEYKENSLESWLTLFNSEYARFESARGDKNVYFFATLYHSLFQNIKRKAPRSEELKRLYHIHAALFCIRKTVESLEQIEVRNYQVDTYIKPYFHNFTDIVLDNSLEMRKVSLPFSLDQLLEESIPIIRETLLSETLFQYERMQMYRLLWATFFNRKKWLEIEENALDTENHVHKIAFAHNRFLQKDDATAIDTMKQLGHQATPYSFWWISYLSEAKSWDRARLWIDYALEGIRDYIFGIQSYEGRRHMTMLFLQNIMTYSDERDSAVYLHALKQLLPYSYVEYNDFLLETDQYRKWVELQIMVGYEVDDMDRSILKEIESLDRGALLPLYHQAVAKAIEGKNRPSYKRAVKYLRKIRTHYKKLKQEDRWDDYITKLATVNKRLRAFQQELMRASMISE
ncbi:SWIM zinc finger family protein [Bacillus sp. REN16]|uniref:SWIM zinc finger family protein n=1 Tax=Bacillus sp. REN16 TaxID=2887296 RepID=UPI001E49087B|nr:SWIM zinc finger family protein [Bacillus sp. REN16]MCC3356173.1 SWIM zinc finger domain-containing protein [Bacillus sp. REN16]